MALPIQVWIPARNLSLVLKSPLGSTSCDSWPSLPVRTLEAQTTTPYRYCDCGHRVYHDND